MRSAIKEILKAIEENVLDRKEQIEVSNFRKIDAKDHGKSIAFVDGGNAEIIKAPNFSLQFIRTCAVVFKANKKKECIKNEFFSLTYAVGELKDIIYRTKIFLSKGSAPDEKDLCFSCLDRTIKQGTEKANISVVGGIARRFAELALASDAKADIIVIDGNLKPVYSNEDKYVEMLLKKGSVVCAVAKTSDILTSKGNCPVSQLNSMNLEHAWHYPTNRRHFAKLNKSSDYVFSIETSNEKDAGLVISQLASNSNDAVFAGYPYGLMLADRLARISNEEKDRMSLLFKTLAGKKWDRIRHYVNAANSHSVLDRIC